MSNEAIKKLTDDEMKDILFQCYVNAEKGEGTTEVQLKAMQAYADKKVKAERNKVFDEMIAWIKLMKNNTP